MKNFLLLVMLLTFTGLTKAQTTIALQSFENLATDTWTYTPNPAAGSFGSGDEWDVVSSLGSLSNVPTDGTSFFGGVDINNGSNPNGTFGILAFNSISVGGYTNVTIEFDYEVDGFDQGDDFEYTVTIDGTPQSEVVLIDGSSNLSVNNTEVITIPDGSSTVSIEVKVTQNGTDYFGVDNFRVKGILASGNPIVGFDASTDNDSEGSSGGNSNISVPVTMNMAPSADVIVSIASADGSATTADSDYLAISTNLTFTAAETYPNTKNITLTIVGDDTIETDEDLTLTLSVTSGMADPGLSTYTFTILNDDFPPLPNIRVNEVDSNTPGTDAAEFVELFGDPNMALDNISLVFFNGNGDSSYRIVDLDGETTDANGFFIYGNIAGAEVAGAVATNLIQNGTDAVALYVGDFPGGAPTTTSLIDALVYGSSGDSGLTTGLGQTEVINEASEGDVEGHSIQRGSWFVAPITPRATNMPLPVEFTYFVGNTNKNTVELTWETAQEIHSDYFLVQKSTDGRNFETIGKVAGQGVKYEPTQYAFSDEETSNGANYYRLKQVDWDGTFDMTSIVIVQVGKESGIAILQNPVANTLVINSKRELAVNSTATITSQAGQVVLTETFTAKSFTQTMNVNSLPTGVYVLRVVNGNEVYTERFVKK